MGGCWGSRFFPSEKDHFFASEERCICQQVHETQALGPLTYGGPLSAQDPTNVFISHTALGPLTYGGPVSAQDPTHNFQKESSPVFFFFLRKVHQIF